MDEQHAKLAAVEEARRVWSANIAPLAELRKRIREAIARGENDAQWQSRGRVR